MPPASTSRPSSPSRPSSLPRPSSPSREESETFPERELALGQKRLGTHQIKRFSIGSVCVCYAYGARATARATAKEKREVTLRGGFPVLVHYGGWRCRQEAGLMNRRPACRWEAVLAPQIHCNQQPQKRERETREQKTGPGPRSFRKSDKQILPRITYVILRGLGRALGPSTKATSKDYRALRT